MKNRSSDAGYAVGIDTCGTYPEAVLFELLKHQIICASKRPTNHHWLARSIVQKLEDFLPANNAEDVQKTAFSTQLAGERDDIYHILARYLKAITT